MLDLEALAAKVAAVLDLDADALRTKRTVYQGAYRINLYQNCLHAFRGDFGPYYQWSLTVLVGTNQHGQTIEKGYRIEYEGQAHPEALAVLSTIWSHVNGQGGEAERISVPRAVLSAHLNAVEDVVGEDDWEGQTSGHLSAAINRLYATAQTIRDALLLVRGSSPLPMPKDVESQ